MKLDINKNLDRVIQELERKGMKTTNIASEIGYTSTTQMYNTIEGKSLLSTKAILRMIQNLDVNPSFIFFGKGGMFLSDESDLDKLKKENKKLQHDKDQMLETIMKLHEIIEKLEKRNDDLIEISRNVLRNYEEKTNSNNADLIIKNNIKE